MTAPRRILVIKLGALGDFVQAFGPFAAIREHHRGDEITLLTSRAYADLARATPWFDDVWIDERPKLWQIGRVIRLRRRLRRARFARVYDLQTSDRSGWYFRLMGGGVEWSGIAPGCSHPHANPDRDAMHTVDRQAEQLAMAGIPSVSSPDIAWVAVPDDQFGIIGERFAVLCPGGAAHRPAKRWPAGSFAALAVWLAARGITPVLIGTRSERDEIDRIKAACPEACDLAGRTSFLDILALGRRAAVAIGNDTGPMHLLAMSGCASVVLFSAESDPVLCAPRGKVRILRMPDLADLSVEQVEETVDALT